MASGGDADDGRVDGRVPMPLGRQPWATLPGQVRERFGSRWFFELKAG